MTIDGGRPRPSWVHGTHASTGYRVPINNLESTRVDRQIHTVTMRVGHVSLWFANTRRG